MSDPLFEVGRSYRMLTGFGWVELPRCESPRAGDQLVSTQEIADRLNYIHENAETILADLGMRL